MADVIRIQYSGACEKVKKAREYKNQQADIFKQLTSLVQVEMPQVWEGNAQTQLAQQFENFKSTFNSFDQALEEYITSMQAWADKLKAADEG